MNNNLKLMILKLIKSIILCSIISNLISILIIVLFPYIKLIDSMFTITLLIGLLGSICLNDGKSLGQNMTSNDGNSIICSKLTKDKYYDGIKNNCNIFLTPECLLGTMAINLIIYLIIF